MPLVLWAMALAAPPSNMATLKADAGKAGRARLLRDMLAAALRADAVISGACGRAYRTAAAPPQALAPGTASPEVGHHGIASWGALARHD